jgi:hypothetical protein
MKFKEYDNKTFVVKKLKPHKVKDLNPNTLRMKTYKRTDYMKTTIPMEKRTLKNIPRYAKGNPKVHFRDWMGMKRCSDTKHSVAKAEADGKYYGWSHRAIAGFAVGDTVKVDTCGNETGKEYTIKDEEMAKQAAINFAKDVS